MPLQTLHLLCHWVWDSNDIVQPRTNDRTDCTILRQYVWFWNIAAEPLKGEDDEREPRQTRLIYAVV